MSAKIINLRQARKRRAREADAARAAENRARSGRTRAERERDEHAETRARKTLDGHLREASADAPDEGGPKSAEPGSAPEKPR